MPIQEGGRFTPNNVIVSPGVFTRENDLSGVTQGVADIGAVVVAPFAKGPGFAPTLVTNSSDLESKFGIADGVYYGPYTAMEYLKQKGFVTVCRVGGLTGYNQKHPLVIYAESGRYQRNGSAGAVDSEYSFVLPSGSYSDGYAAGITFNYTSSAFTGEGTGNITFNSPTFALTLQVGAIDTTNFTSASIASNSGSLLFNNQEVTFTTTLDVDADITYTGSGATITFAQLLASGTLSGVFSETALELTSFGTDPFDVNTYLISGSFRVDNQSGCTTPIFRINGILSGSFGQYNGEFEAIPPNGAPYLDNCGNLHPGSGTKILGILNDTLFGGIDSATLNAPGFSGSTIVGDVLDATSGSIFQDYTLYLTSSAGSAYGAYQFSLSKATNQYITNVFGNKAAVGDPNKYAQGQKIEAAYLYATFEDSIAEVQENADSWRVKVAAPIQLDTPFSGGYEPLIFTDDYSLAPTTGDSAYSLTHAATPFIVSQAVAGVNGQSHRFELFKVHTLADGTNTNTAYKIEISNVKLAGTVAGTEWGSFTLSVRSYSDTENRPNYLESYQNLSLDPNSPNYIARRIGDRYNYITFAGKIIEFGTYANLSKNIRIEMTDINYPVSAVPYGFEAYLTPFGGAVIDDMTPTLKYTKASVSSNSPGKYASGVVFGETLTSDGEIAGLYPMSSANTFIYEDNLQYFKPIPANATGGKNVGFYLDEDYTTNGVGTSTFISSSTGGEYMNAVPATLEKAYENTYIKMRRFVLGFQGGFDGQSPAIAISVGSDISAGNTQGLNCATISDAGSVAYKQCIGALSNADEFDINLIVTPGIFHSQHSYVAQLVMDMCEQRGDCFYIMDNVVFPSSNQSTGLIDAAVNDVSTIDSNYVATYYPWIKILDTNLNKIVSVPPSVIMPSIYASSDNSAAEWFAPAGLNRGGITQAVQTLDRLTFQERDTLYAGRVNPIAAFPGQGICVWGQKTLQIKHSALDRINVRRLMIALKKFIASTSKYLVFEQNVADTRNRFLSVVNPYLESVQQRSGLYAYKVVMDATNNTPDIIDNNILYGQIYLQPAKTAEFIVLDFNILPTGAVFPGA